jgi:RNA polymerase sigma factor (sigma-70 family)
VAHLDDVRLVRSAQGGDRAAFGALIQRHRPLLVACCRRMLGAGELVEEAAQESVVQALLGLDRLREPDRFGPWLAGIGLNVCRHLLRERSARAWSPEAVVDERALDGALADPQELAEAAELVARVRRAVAALPHGQRDAVTLFYLSGLTQREVAAALGIDVGAVKGRLHKARRALRQRLIEFQEAVEMTQADAAGGVAVQVIDVVRRQADGGEPRHVVVLQEVGGGRSLNLWVGRHEAEMLAVHLEALETPRPLTYAFAARLLEASGATLDEVRISRLSDSTYYADAIVSSSGTTRSVDARPSDALNLAVLLGRPVTVEPEVFEAARLDEERHPWAAAGEAVKRAGEIAREAVARMIASHRPSSPANVPSPPEGEGQGGGDS